LGEDAEKNFVNLNEEKRKNIVINTLTKLFGDEARNYIYYKDYSYMDEKYILGAFTGHNPPNLITNITK